MEVSSITLWATYNMLFIESLVLKVLIFQFLAVKCAAYTLRCPTGVEWNLKALSLCKDIDKYYCLYNDVNTTYVEGCEVKSDWDRKGCKRIYSGYFTRDSCIATRYQPFKFYTNESSDCVYQKSYCNEHGQFVFSEGNTETDRLCSCNYSDGFAFITTPEHIFFCNPSSNEDCACYRKECLNGFTLSKDYSCIENTTSQQMTTTEEYTTYDRYMNSTIYLSDLALKGNAQTTAFAIVVIILAILVIFSLLGVHKLVTNCKKGIPKQIAEKETNFLKLMFLFYQIATPVVRILLDKAIPSDTFQNICNMLSKEIKINERQKKMLKGDTSKHLGLLQMVELLTIVRNTDTPIANSPIKLSPNVFVDVMELEKMFRLITENNECLIPDEHFDIQWDYVSLIVLRLSATELQEFYVPENRILKGSLEGLHPLKLVNTQLYKFLQLHELYSSRILKQIIVEYCSEAQTLSELLKGHQHSLFHKRLRTDECCLCRQNKHSLFTKVIPEVLWKKMFEEKTSDHEKNSDHEKKSDLEKKCTTKNCVECFIAKEDVISNISERDISLVCTLILYIPELLTYTVRCLYKGNFAAFLNTPHCKHVLQCEIKKELEETMFCISDWNELYNTSCSRIKAQRRININSLDDKQIFKLFSLVGPLSFIQSCSTDMFEHFSKGLMENDYLISMCQKITDTNKALLNVIKDEKFKRKIKEDMLSLAREDTDDSTQEQVIEAWIAECYTQVAEKSKLMPVLLKSTDGKDETTWQHARDLRLKGNRKVPEVSFEQNNFLKIVYLIYFVAKPVVQNVFDRYEEEEAKCYERKLAEQHSTVTKCYGLKHVEEFDIVVNFLSANQRSTSVYLTEEDHKAMRPKNKKITSKDLSLKLLIHILNVLKYKKEDPSIEAGETRKNESKITTNRTQVKEKRESKTANECTQGKMESESEIAHESTQVKEKIESQIPHEKNQSKQKSDSLIKTESTQEKQKKESQLTRESTQEKEKSESEKKIIKSTEIAEKEAIDTIDHHRRVITQSRDGKFSRQAFKNIRKKINEAIIDLGGSEYLEKILWLDDEENIIQHFSNHLRRSTEKNEYDDMNRQSV